MFTMYDRDGKKVLEARMALRMPPRSFSAQHPRTRAEFSWLAECHTDGSIKFPRRFSRHQVCGASDGSVWTRIRRITGIRRRG
jgi:hypothetical protein